MKNKRLLVILLISFLVLLIPFVAMQFTKEVNWSLGDFVVAGCLLVGTGLVLEIISRKVKNSKYKRGFIILVLIMLILIWVELAVGVFGTPFAGS